MKKNNIAISIIIVHYRVENRLRECITSIIKSVKNISFEVIVVDNDEEQRLSSSFRKDFPSIKIINNKNTGFGAGNNLGSESARGEYLFFLNPDTKVLGNCVKNLYDFLKKNRTVGLVAPQLFHPNNKIFKLQGMSVLTPLRAIFSLSFIYKFFPQNSIASNYFFSKWNKKKIKYVDVLPGTAFMISKELFFKVGKFDEIFFLYFEEFDLCKRIKELGFKACILPEGRIIHFWGESTAHRADISDVFKKSRFYYFKKHFGLPKAIFVEFFLRLNRNVLLLTLGVVISLVPMFYKLDSLMVFIGDQAWFYISARDFLTEHTIPLVGIASSHPWLHQGAFWTYMLASAFFVGGFDPLVGAYLSIAITILTAILLYVVSAKMFSQGIALFSALAYLFSPLIVFYARMPYHTVPIPFFTICLMYSIYLWIGKSSKKSFYASFLFLGVLYNFELATVFLSSLIILALMLGFLKKRKYVAILSLKDLVFAFLFFMIPLIPIVIYDFTHGFKQTIVFGGWILYHLGRSALAVFSSGSGASGYSDILSFFGNSLRRLIFLPNMFVSLIIFFTSVLYIIDDLFKKKENGYKNAQIVIVGFLLLPSLVIFFNKVPSDAYLPVTFPSIFVVIGYFFHTMYKYSKNVTVICFVALLSLNTISLIFTNYGVDLSFEAKKNIAQSIINDSKNKEFSIKGVGEGSEFESFIMPYEYILWYYGHPSVDRSSIVFEVQEFKNTVIIRKSYD